MQNKLDICEEYIWQICCMIDMSDGGAPALYGLEQHRIELHERLCNLFGIDHIKSKEVLSYLDDKIGLDTNVVLNNKNSDAYLKIYAQNLCNYIHEHIEELA